MTSTEITPAESHLPPSLVVPTAGRGIDDLLSREWLIANSIGAYASSTVIGCNARRYHGLLVAATTPPVGRIVTLSTVMEQVHFGGQAYELGVNEFPDAFSPRGVMHLVEFRNDAAPTYIYRFGGLTLVKEILLADSENAVALRYRISGGDATIRLWPFIALRDFHGLRKSDAPHQVTFEARDQGVCVQDRMTSQHALYMTCGGARFEPKAQWWYRFTYRIDLARGQDGHEDLYTPGLFVADVKDGQCVQLTASMKDPRLIDFEQTLDGRARRLGQLAQSVGPEADDTTRRLAVASDAFVVQRHFPAGPPSPTLVAGYHWFGDWGRDTFISLPGLLLCTGRFAEARNVFQTFAGAIQNGLVPNRFDDYSFSAHYNSMDASLWFIIAAERYVQATGDVDFWRSVLMPAVHAILSAFHDGTKFDIHADADGLLVGGSRTTQLTWMDAKLGDEAITPRHGKAVEINALWHAAHWIMSQRCRGIDDGLANQYEHRAELIAPAFVKTFWNQQLGWLYDCISDNWPDASLRPNQILAVSLPHSPLPAEMQQSVVRIVTDKLLTPYGLRTLSPNDGRYRRRYGTSWETRDRAYHQGTVWAWLMGPFIEAFLKVEMARPLAVAQAKKWLQPFDAHLLQAGIGTISEIFDGDAPHTPAGCIGQAWSVAEVLRAKMLVAQAERDNAGR